MPPINRITIIGCSLLILIALIMMGIWYIGRVETPSIPQLSSSPKPFSQKDQVVPPNAESRSVDQSLAAFGFSKPLPFFEKDNIVQSLKLDTSSTASPATSFLSYRIYGQSVASVRDALTRYFVSLGWKQIDDGANQGYLSFGFDHGKIISVNMLERPATPGTEPRITVTLSLYISNL